ncbi:uncharacterized protein LOC135484825 [Lineus longissimus]|uniref:uncharacterized protein LOC135484825 n=1 Tax=Lineus longissimus TaxID=88925 RepID=UPI00315CC351
MIKFILLVNKQGQVRVGQYYEPTTKDDKDVLEGEVIRRCLTRGDNQCSFVEYRNFKLIYRRYATLFFIIGVDEEENELGILEFIHLVVETLDKYFEKVCEQDVSLKVQFERENISWICSQLIHTPKILIYSLIRLQIICHCEKIYMILDEMVANGRIIETNHSKILAPLRMMEQHTPR